MYFICTNQRLKCTQLGNILTAYSMLLWFCNICIVDLMFIKAAVSDKGEMCIPHRISADQRGRARTDRVSWYFALKGPLQRARKYLAKDERSREDLSLPKRNMIPVIERVLIHLYYIILFRSNRMMIISIIYFHLIVYFCFLYFVEFFFMHC